MQRPEIDRRKLLALMGGGALAGTLMTPDRVFAQALQRVNYMFAFNSLSTTVANQTSIPRQFGMFKAAGLQVEWHEFDKVHTIAGEAEMAVIRNFVSARFNGQPA